MSRSTNSDDGFATAAAMAVSLAIGLGASAILIRAAGDLRIARSDYERTRAAYALDAIQTLVAEDLIDKDPSAKLRRIDFDTLSATVRIEDEAPKVRPSQAGELPDSWYVSLGVNNPEPMKASLKAKKRDKPWSLEAIAALDAHPLWKACASSVISAEGAHQVMTDQLDPKHLPRTVRLTAEGEGGWVEDRIVRLTGDPAAPVLLLDRRLYRRTSDQPSASCPPLPDLPRA